MGCKMMIGYYKISTTISPMHLAAQTARGRGSEKTQRKVAKRRKPWKQSPRRLCCRKKIDKSLGNTVHLIGVVFVADHFFIDLLLSYRHSTLSSSLSEAAIENGVVPVQTRGLPGAKVRIVLLRSSSFYHNLRRRSLCLSPLTPYRLVALHHTQK